MRAFATFTFFAACANAYVTTVTHTAGTCESVIQKTVPTPYATTTATTTLSLPLTTTTTSYVYPNQRDAAPEKREQTTIAYVDVSWRGCSARPFPPLTLPT